jgi:hypothetical protein
MTKLLENSWTDTLKSFFLSKLHFNNEKPGTFCIEGVFELKIEVSNNYGFLCLKFTKKEDLLQFISNTSINIEKTTEGNFEWRYTNWSNEDFPCRVFVSNDNKILSFYDNETIESDQKATENRIITLKNVIHAIIDWKVSKVLNT